MRKTIKKIFISEEKGLRFYFTEPNCIYTFLNPVSYLDSRYNKHLFEKFDSIFVDGSILINAIKLFYHKRLTRRSFDMTSIVPALFNYSIENNKSIYIVGASEKEIELSINIFREKYPNLNIIGYRNGFFYTKEDVEKEYNNIILANPDFLIVGMGIIHQEKFLLEIRTKGYSGIGFTCGGFISQTAKGIDKIDYYPQWINKYNLRFLYRIYKESHTRQRYLKAAFIFPVMFIKDWIDINIAGSK